MKENLKYKSPIGSEIVVTTFGLVFIVGMYIGIWVDNYNLQFVLTSIFSLFLAIIIIIIESENEKKFNEEHKK